LGKLRRGSYVYIDKTGHIFRLINQRKYYFLCRPHCYQKERHVWIVSFLSQSGGEGFLYEAFYHAIFFIAFLLVQTYTQDRRADYYKELVLIGSGCADKQVK
jgi:hypothetical protein